MTKPADSDQRAKARERVAIKWLAEQGYQPSDEGFETWKRHGTTVGIQGLDLSGLLTSFAISERQAVIEDCAKMADQIAQSCSACSYSREKHGEEPSFCENFGCSNFADLATAIRSME